MTGLGIFLIYAGVVLIGFALVTRWWDRHEKLIEGDYEPEDRLDRIMGGNCE